MNNLPSNEKILYEGCPTGRTLIMWAMKKAFFSTLYYFLVVGWIPIFLKYTLGSDQVFNYLIPVDFLVFFCLLVIIVIYQIPLARSHKYLITDKNIVVKAGVLSKRERTIALDKVINITVSQDFLEQIFGLFRLRIQTAVEFGEVSFLGLSDVETPKNIITRLIKK